MSAIVPNIPQFSSARDGGPACEWVMPAFAREGDYARTCKALPPGMPDCLEVHVVHSDEGVERSTAVIYGARAFLVHYMFEPHRGAAVTAG